MQSEYERIRGRTQEDPGTAGDEGEETWAALLRDWLPESYRVVTKGRLLAADGSAGPQLDVLVLRPGYPIRLINKKLYLVGGVAAVFECKNTLTAAHVKNAFRQAQAINDLSSERSGTPFMETVPEVYFGVLAHSTSWTSVPDDQRSHVDGLLQQGLTEVAGMKDCPSLICVADLGCWDLIRFIYDGPGIMPAHVWQARRQMTGAPAEGGASISYMRFADDVAQNQAPPTPIAVAVAQILGRLAHDDATLRPLSQYFFAAGLSGSGVGVAVRRLPLSAYSDQVRQQLPARLINGGVGSEWSMVYAF